MQPVQPDRWAAPAGYELFMGRWSRRLAHKFVDWLETDPGLHWLEVGCGTGSLTEAIVAAVAPASMVACDPAAPFIEHARLRIRDQRVAFVVASADDFPMRAGGYDCITSLLALNFFPDPRSALARMCTAATPGGVVSACVWDYAGGMELLRYFWDAAAALFPDAAAHDEGSRFPLCAPDRLEELFRSAGLARVICDPIEVETRFTSFEDYWEPFLGGTGPAPSFVASLPDAGRAQLRTALASALPGQPDGGVALRARAWAIRGHVE